MQKPLAQPRRANLSHRRHAACVRASRRFQIRPASLRSSSVLLSLPLRRSFGIGRFFGFGIRFFMLRFFSLEPKIDTYYENKLHTSPLFLCELKRYILCKLIHPPTLSCYLKDYLIYWRGARPTRGGARPNPRGCAPHV